MIDPIPLFNYPLDNSQSVFSGEEYTALELAGKTAKKMNEVVEIANGIELNAIESRAIVDDMKLAQEQFIIENNDVRSNLVSDNQDFLDALEASNTTFQNGVTASKTAFETAMTNDLNTFKSDLDAAQETYETGLAASKTAFETNMNNELDTFKTNLNTSKTTFETGLNTSKTAFETGMTNDLNTFKSSLDSEKATYTDALDQVIVDGNAAVANINTTVTTAVGTKINDMVTDGSLETIINDELLGGINEEINGIWINVKDFGAVGNGVTDDTAAIQAAIDSLTVGTVLIENGTYMIKGTDGTPTRDGDKGGIKAKSKVNIFIRNATLKVINTNFTDYNIIRCTDVQNAKIYGQNGIIEGDRLTNQSATGEHGFGIGLWNAKNIHIHDLTIKNCWGDSIILTNTSPWTDYCENVTIERVICDNNRRQGISVTVAKNTVINDCVFKNIHGTSPESGIDVEPNMVGDILEDTKITNCHFYANVSGMVLHGGKNTVVNACSFRGNTAGLGINQNDGAVVTNCTFINNTGTQISCEVATNNVINNNYIIGGQTGISMSNNSLNNTVCNNVIKDASVVGIQAVVGGNHMICGNHILNTPKGIDLYLSNKNQVIGNRVYAQRAISCAGDYNTVQNNQFSGGSGADVNVQGSANMYCNNDMYGMVFYDTGTGTVKTGNRPDVAA